MPFLQTICSTAFFFGSSADDAQVAFEPDFCGKREAKIILWRAAMILNAMKKSSGTSQLMPGKEGFVQLQDHVGKQKQSDVTSWGLVRPSTATLALATSWWYLLVGFRRGRLL